MSNRLILEYAANSLPVGYLIELPGEHRDTLVLSRWRSEPVARPLGEPPELADIELVTLRRVQGHLYRRVDEKTNL